MFYFIFKAFLVETFFVKNFFAKFEIFFAKFCVYIILFKKVCLFLARANLPCPILVQLIFIGCNNGHNFPHNYIPDFEGLEVSGVLNRSK